MCREDLQLGRGRYVGQRKNTTTSVATWFKQNERRVAMLFSWTTIFTFDPAVGSAKDNVVFSPSDDFNDLSGVVGGSSSGQILLKVEEVGNLVTGPWSVVVSAVASLVVVAAVEILSDVEAEAIRR